MNIFITGGSGFIGRNLVERLGIRHNIYAPSHPELDLLDTAAVEKYFKDKNIDIVIHCAVKPGHRNSKDSSNELYCNTRMFFNLTRNQDKFKKMIYIGTGLVYGINYYQPLMREEYVDEHIPEDEAGLSKYIISKYIEDHPNIIELRVFGIFGKYEDYAIRFPSNMICKAIFNHPMTMKQNRRFSYIYIDDLAPIIEYFICNEPKYNIFNVTPDKQIELLDLARMIKDVTKTQSEIIVATSGIGVEYTGDNSRLHREMKDLKFTPIEKALKELSDWYLKSRKQINTKVLLKDK